MRPMALTSTTSKRLSGGKAEKKTKWVAKGRPWRKKFSKIPLEGDATTVTHFTSHPVLPTLPRLPLVPWILPFVCADVYATCTRYVAHRKHARYTCNVTRELVGARDIRGTQFIFSADSSKNLLHLVCRRSSRRRSPDASPL